MKTWGFTHLEIQVASKRFLFDSHIAQRSFRRGARLSNDSLTRLGPVGDLGVYNDLVHTTAQFDVTYRTSTVQRTAARLLPVASHLDGAYIDCRVSSVCRADCRARPWRLRCADS